MMNSTHTTNIPARSTPLRAPTGLAADEDDFSFGRRTIYLTPGFPIWLPMFPANSVAAGPELTPVGLPIWMIWLGFGGARPNSERASVSIRCGSLKEAN